MPRNDLTGTPTQQVAALLARLDDIERAVTPGEKAAAELALQVECAVQDAAALEDARQRVLDRLRFRAVLREAGEDPPLI